MSNRNDFVNSVRDMTETDLKLRIEEDQLRLKKLKFAHAVSHIENPMTIRGVRRDIARLQTELKKKKLAKKEQVQTDAGANDESVVEQEDGSTSQS